MIHHAMPTSVAFYRFWLVLAGVLLSLCWLIPNHTQPWTSFHSDVWAGIVLLGVASVAFAASTRQFELYLLPLAIGVLACLPFIQLAVGLLTHAGQAWIAFAFLWGFMLAFFAGQRWQGWRPMWLGDFLFLAIGVAAALSVCLQFQQWVGTGQDQTLDVWAATSTGNGRPSANLGQANQLATLLLWGLLACAWGWWRGHVRGAMAVVAASILLFGLTLTQSRTGALGAFSLVLGAWCWRAAWGKMGKPFALCVTGLAALYVVMVIGLSWIDLELLLKAPAAASQRLEGELRPRIWRMFWDAALQRPFGGYGWKDVVSAQLSVANQHPAVWHPFFQSHNLFLDFVLWLGIPLGLLLAVSLLVWLVVAARRINRPQQFIYFMMLMAVGIHAMLELPLHYAYFLLPTGIAVGALSADLGIWKIGRISAPKGKFLLLSASLLGGAVLAVLVRDYLKVEEGFVSIQLERAGIVGARSPKLPDVWMLTQLREAQRFMKLEPLEGEALEAQSRWAEDMVQIVPSPRGFMNVAILKGLAGHAADAQFWLIKMCKVVPREQCALGPERWLRAQQAYPRLLTIAWPNQSNKGVAILDAEIRKSDNLKEP